MKSSAATAKRKSSRTALARPSALLIAAAALLTAATRVGAHGVLVYSSLQGGPVPAETSEAVTLRFNAGIEVSLSRVLLLNPQGEERSVSVAAGAKSGEVFVQLPPLTPGSYQLHYKVLASDGHLTDGFLRFTVAGEQQAR